MQTIEKPKIDLKKCETIKCEKCGGIFFKEVIIFKKVPKIMTGSIEDTNVPFPVPLCNNCGHLNKDQNPFEETSNVIEKE